MKEVVLTIIFGFSIKFCTHSCTKFESAKIATGVPKRYKLYS